MDMTVEELGDDGAKIVLRGRFDTTSAVLIELPLTTLVSDKRRLLVDLSEVNFLSSFGIRVLLVAAKAAATKSGKLVLLCPDNVIARVLRTAGVHAIIPLFHAEEQARGAIA